MSPVSQLRRLPRSLVILIQAVVGLEVAVEIRHGVRVTGILDSVDTNMNLTLSDATYITPVTLSSSQSRDRAPTNASSGSGPLDSLYVASRHITFIHLPHQLDVFETVDNHVGNVVVEAVLDRIYPSSDALLERMRWIPL